MNPKKSPQTRKVKGAKKQQTASPLPTRTLRSHSSRPHDPNDTIDLSGSNDTEDKGSVSTRHSKQFASWPLDLAHLRNINPDNVEKAQDNQHHVNAQQQSK
jgi:hypothetical protein